MNRHHYGLILAGGRGTRFWPRSRKRSAKQVLNVVGERSLIQSTVDRLKPLIAPERLWVLTNDHLRDIIIKQLPEVPRNQILAEPLQRNTAPAIGLAAQILHSLDPDAVMGVFPSDHVIGKIPQYRNVVKTAFKAAGDRHLVVVGIQPRWPETGYGYIEFPRGCPAGRTNAIEMTSSRVAPVNARVSDTRGGTIESLKLAGDALFTDADAFSGALRRKRERHHCFRHQTPARARLSDCTRSGRLQL